MKKLLHLDTPIQCPFCGADAKKWIFRNRLTGEVRCMKCNNPMPTEAPEHLTEWHQVVDAGKAGNG